MKLKLHHEKLKVVTNQQQAQLKDQQQKHINTIMYIQKQVRNVSAANNVIADMCVRAKDIICVQSVIKRILVNKMTQEGTHTFIKNEQSDLKYEQYVLIYIEHKNSNLPIKWLKSFSRILLIICEVEILTSLTLFRFNKINNIKQTSQLNQSSTAYLLKQLFNQGQVIVMKSASLLTTAGVLKTYIYGIASNGTFFVYDFNAKSIIYKTQANHTESIFQFLPHPSFSNMFASVSADATVKVWKDGIDSFQLDQQFGQSGYQRFYSQSSNNYIQKNIQHQGMIDTQSILGPLLSGAWDPRKDSCLMMVGSFKGNVAVVDIWRSQVHASYSPHSQRVCDIAWTTYPKCIACSVGADGIGRIYGFEQPLHLDSDTFKLSENYIEFCQNTCKLIGCSFSSHEPLLAIACEDGYVRVYDLRLFTQNKDQIRSYYLKNNLQHNHIAPIQIGKFAVSDSPLFKVVFHPKMKNVIGVTCDSGEVKVYRFEYDGASTVMGGGIAFSCLLCEQLYIKIFCHFQCG
ncbi:WD40_repeat protein [Hexamita inflata]|uniref:WD40 repeat protein n=1 Tax=Hexamita inflata TaxID=28002 RepID=A0AA86QMY2_9EUKA|nr:WD40 repeat protein [Hexamita inflata]